MNLVMPEVLFKANLATVITLDIGAAWFQISNTLAIYAQWALLIMDSFLHSNPNFCEVLFI